MKKINILIPAAGNGRRFADVGYEDPKQMILQEAEGWGADCIFIGARGLNPLERLLLGSVSRSVAARAHCSVEVVRQRKQNT